MAYNVHAYNYIEGSITRTVPADTSYEYYQMHGSTVNSNYAWCLEFESIKISAGNTELGKCRQTNDYGWTVSINSSLHPVISRKNSSGSGSYTFSDITVSTNTWFSIKFEQTGSNSSSAYNTITCTYNGSTTDTVTAYYRYNINYHFSLIIGSANTTIRGDVIIKGYTYGSNTLYTGTINPDSVNVGAETISSTGTVNSFSCSAVKRFADTLQLKISNAWKSATPYIKINGSWKKVSDVYLKIDGSWKKIT